MENISNLYNSFFGGSVEGISEGNKAPEANVEQDTTAVHPMGLAEESKTEGTSLSGKSIAEVDPGQQVQDVQEALVNIFNNPEEKEPAQALILMLISALPGAQDSKNTLFNSLKIAIESGNTEDAEACFRTLENHITEMSDLEKSAFDTAVETGIKNLLAKFPKSQLMKTLNNTLEQGFLNANSAAIKGALITGISGVVFGVSFVAMSPAAIAGGSFFGATVLTKLAVFMVSNPSWFMPFWTLGAMPAATSGAIVSGGATLGVNLIWEGTRYGTRAIRSGANLASSLIFGQKPEDTELIQEEDSDEYLLETLFPWNEVAAPKPLPSPPIGDNEELGLQDDCAALA